MTPGKTAAGGKPKTKEERNPQAVVYNRNPSDRWQTFIDHARLGPIPNMCLRWHLNRVCDNLCLIRSSHVEMTDGQRQKLMEWIADCRNRMGRPGAMTGTPKKPKLGPSDAAYPRFLTSHQPNNHRDHRAVQRGSPNVPRRPGREQQSPARTTPGQGWTHRVPNTDPETPLTTGPRPRP